MSLQLWFIIVIFSSNSDAYQALISRSIARCAATNPKAPVTKAAEPKPLAQSSLSASPASGFLQATLPSACG